MIDHTPSLNICSGRHTRFRPVLADDVDYFERWWQEPDANILDGGTDDSPPVGMADKWRDGIREGRFSTLYTIETLAGIPIGYILYRNIDEETSSVELAIRIAQQYWGKGYGTDATGCFCRYLAEERDVRRITLTVWPKNHRARRMYEKCGFQYTGKTVEDDGIQFLQMERFLCSS